MIDIGTLRCLDCSVSWSGSSEPCWSCGGTGVNPYTDPAAMITVRWPSITSPYTETRPAGSDTP